MRLPPHLVVPTLWYDPVGALTRWRRSYGDLFSIDLPTLGPIVVVGEPGAAHDVLTSDPATSSAGTATGRLLPLLHPACVLRLDGAAHVQRRQLLNPFFHGDALSRRRTTIEGIVRRELSRWPRGRPIHTLGRLRDLTFAVICELLLGVTDPPTVEHLHRLIRRSTGPVALAGTWLWPIRSGSLQDWASRRVQRHQVAVGGALVGVVDGEITGSSSSDVLTALVQAAHASGPLAGALYDELRALLVVGHETTAAALAWSLERLARSPAIATRLAASIDDQDSSSLRSFIFEVLRWRPPVVDTVRELTEPLTAGDHRLDPGTLVMVSPYLVHHHPAAYEQPGRFDPDRFDGRRAPDPRVWIPFGGGSRRCLGAELAVTEMEVVLSELLGRALLVPARSPGERARLSGTVLVPARGARIRLAPEQSARRGVQRGRQCSS